MGKCVVCGFELVGSVKYCSDCGAFQTGSKSHPDKDLRFSSIFRGESIRHNTVDIPAGEALFNKRFRIDSLIGQGAFGRVYLATDNDASNRQVALKVVPTAEGEEQKAADQLRNEIRLYDRIDNFRHIIRPNDIYLDPDYKGLPLVLLSMEYADGGSLRKWLKENMAGLNQLEVRNEGVRMFLEACAGVKAIHEAGMVHLDLKPENLLLLGGKVKVADLGFSRNYVNYAQNREEILKEFGTPAYMSPEQFRSARQKDINQLSDIYSLGVILFELLDGHIPFDGDYSQLREKHINFKPPVLDGDLSAWGKLISRCMSKKPQDRYPSAESLISC